MVRKHCVFSPKSGGETCKYNNCYIGMDKGYPTPAKKAGPQTPSL